MIFMRLLVCLLTLGFMLSPVHAAETTRSFLDGIKSYQAEDYASAVAEFSSITDTGIQNGKLFYNLANAYLKSGNIGRAMLWYERALRMIPDDPDLKFNHNYGLSLVKDEKEETRLPIFKVLFFWQQLLSARTIQHLALIFNSILWMILLLQVIGRQRILIILRQVIMLLTIIFMLTACYNAYASRYLREGIVLSNSVSVRSGLAEDSTELFTLHAGTKVKIEKENQDFYKIFFSEGKIGWLKKTEIGVI